MSSATRHAPASETTIGSSRRLVAGGGTAQVTVEGLRNITPHAAVAQLVERELPKPAKAFRAATARLVQPANPGHSQRCDPCSAPAYCDLSFPSCFHTAPPAWSVA